MTSTIIEELDWEEQFEERLRLFAEFITTTPTPREFHRRLTAETAFIRQLLLAQLEEAEKGHEAVYAEVTKVYCETTIETGWEKEFERLFLWKRKGYWEFDICKTGNVATLIKFIRSLLVQQRKEIGKKIRGMRIDLRKKLEDDTFLMIKGKWQEVCRCGFESYNQALDDALAKLSIQPKEK